MNLFMVGATLLVSVITVIYAKNVAKERYLEERSAVGFALAPNMSLWEQLLLPSPTVISFIGQLVVHSSKIDVSLEKQTPKNGWQHVNHPESLRSALLQVGNDGWEAFNVAQTNMDHVAVSMMQVPRHVKTSLKMIATQKPEYMARFLKIPMDQIRRIGEQSVQLTTEIEQGFTDMMGLTAELSESVSAAQGAHDREILENNKTLEIQQTLKESMEEKIADMQKQYDDQAAVVTASHAAYQERLDSIPTGFKAFAMDLVRATVPAVAQGVLSIKGGSAAGVVGALGSSTAGIIDAVQDKDSYQVTGNGTGYTGASYYDSVILNQMGVLSKTIPQIETFLNGKKENPNSETSDEGVFHALSSFVGIAESSFEPFPETSIKQKAKSAVGVLETVSTKAIDILDSMDIFSKEDATEMLDSVKSTYNDMQQMIAAGEAAGINLGMTNPNSQAIIDGGGLTGANERFAAQVAMQKLENDEQRKDAMYRELMVFNDQLTNLEVEMKKLDIENINLNNIRELLRQVLLILGKIREHWSTMVRFFQIVAVRARVINESYLSVFVDMTETSGEIIAAGDDGMMMRQMLVDQLAEQATDIQVVCYYLHTLADTYVKISSKHLMGRLAGMAKLLAADSDAEREELLEELQQGADVARAGILAIIEEKRESYQKELDSRKEDLEMVVAKLGPPTQIEQQNAEAGIHLLETNTIVETDEKEESNEDIWDDLF